MPGFLTRASLWRTRRIAQESHCRPSALIGLPPDDYRAYDFDHAVFMLGDWFERKRAETVEVPIDKTPRKTQPKPKHDDAALRAFLNIGEPVRHSGSAGGTPVQDTGLDDVFAMLTELDDPPAA